MINLEKEIRQQPQVLASVSSVNAETVAKIAKQAKESGVTGIAFAARGTSDHAAIFAQYLFHRFTGMPCSLATPSVVTCYGAHMQYAHTLVIGISQSGCAADVRAVIEDAKLSGAMTVAITNDSASPLACSADYHLFCSAGPETSIAATKTFTAQMYVLTMLCEAFAHSEELKKVLQSVPVLAQQLLDTVPQQIDTCIARYRYLQDAFVLGRGMAYPIALEGALKILETNKIRVRGYACSDFQHGPMAQLSAGTLAIILAPSGPTQQDALTMIDKASATGTEYLIVTDDAALSSAHLHSILIPGGAGDCAASFLLAMAMQLFALKLTEIKGIDPDQSDVLKKITITK